jgi:hypothetical protein
MVLRLGVSRYFDASEIPVDAVQETGIGFFAHPSPFASGADGKVALRKEAEYTLAGGDRSQLGSGSDHFEPVMTR